MVSKKCGKPHASLLNGSGRAYCQAAGVLVQLEAHYQRVGECDNERSRSAVVIEVQTIKAGNGGENMHNSTVFFDNGATATLCTHARAERAKLEGSPVVIYLWVLGQNYQEVEFLHYTLHRFGCEHQLTTVGMDMLTDLV